MDRTTAALEIRAYLDDRLVTHEEWGSRFPYSEHPSSRDFRVEQQVGHYHGRSSQLTRVRKDAEAVGAKQAEINQARYVDYIHFVSNGWEHGVAYCLIGGGLTGLIYEARSAWYPHGAHFGDSDKTDFPVYQMLGKADVQMTEAQVDIHFTVAEMLVELFGMHRQAQTDHGSVPGNSTSCAGSNLYRPFINLDSIGMAERGTTYPPSATPDPPDEGDAMSALPDLQQTWFKPGDPGGGDEVRHLQSVLNLHDVLDMEGGINYSKKTGKFDGVYGPSTAEAVRTFQRANGLLVDGKVGQFTWDRLISRLSN